jgi:hypothetical protein
MEPRETRHISPHLLKVFEYVRDARRWVTVYDIEYNTAVAARTARAHARALVRERLFEHAPLFPGHRFRYSPDAEQRNPDYLRRLTEAREMFGPDLEEEIR